jgi:hypothetical protein
MHIRDFAAYLFFFRRRDIPTDSFCGFTHCFEENARIVSKCRPRPIPSSPFPIDYVLNILPLSFWVKGPAADAYCATPWWRWSVCSFYGAPVEWNRQGKTEVLGEKPVPVPLCPPQMPQGLTRDRTCFSALGGRQLTAWAMARPCSITLLIIVRVSTSVVK